MWCLEGKNETNFGKYRALTKGPTKATFTDISADDNATKPISLLSAAIITKWSACHKARGHCLQVHACCARLIPERLC